MAEKHLYEIKHIETSFRTDGKMFKAIEDVSLYLNPGEIIGIVGESGSGKSVTMMSALPGTRKGDWWRSVSGWK